MSAKRYPRLYPTRHRESETGFTLIELVVAIILLGLLGTVGVSMIANTLTTTQQVNATQTGAGQARYALERLEREIREVRFLSSNYSIATLTATKMVFTKPDGVTVTICNGSLPDCTGGADLSLSYTASATTTSATLNNQLSGFSLEFRDSNNCATTSTSNSTIAASDFVDCATTVGGVRFVDISLNVPDTSHDGQSLTLRTRIALRNA